MLADREHDERELPLIAAALGDVRGPAGSAALRSAVAEAFAQLRAGGPRVRQKFGDVAYASVGALGQRDGAAATDVLLEAARQPHPDVSDLGLDALAAVGDDRAWDEMAARLAEVSRGKSAPGGRRQAEIRHIIEYLAKYAPLASDRAAWLITLVRERWQNVLEQWWPGIGPNNEAPPETVNLGTHVHLAPWQPPPGYRVEAGRRVVPQGVPVLGSRDGTRLERRHGRGHSTGDNSGDGDLWEWVRDR